MVLDNNNKSDQSERNFRIERFLKLKTRFPYRFDRTHKNHEVIENYKILSENKITVRVAGRLIAKREHGKTKFGDLQDQSAKIQIYFRKDILGSLYDKLDLVDIGDILGIEGEVFKTHKGEITVMVKSFEILNKSLRTLPEKWHGLKDPELRYRQRYLDLISNSKARNIILLRSRIIQNLRKFFEERGFVEIETPILQPIYGGAAAKPFETYYNVLEEKMFLRISDELYLKRLIIGGIEKVFEIGKDFRNEGIDRFHNPEFTQLEAYEAYKDYFDMMELVEDLFRFLTMNLFNSYKITYQGIELDFSKPWNRIKFCDILNDKLGLDILKVSHKELEELAIKHGIIEPAPKTNHHLSSAKLIDKLFSRLVQKEIVNPTFVIDYPKITTPLARTHRENSLLVERFEPFICGIEIGNAFSELNDPLEQRIRFEEQLKYQEEYATLDEDFLCALEYGMPPTAGLGLGIDRIVMILGDVDSIREVIPFPQLKPK